MAGLPHAAEVVLTRTMIAISIATGFDSAHAMTSSDVPDHLRGTAELVARAYPRGIAAADYLPLLSVLAEHMSQSNLALLADTWNDHVGSGYNDVLRVLSDPLPASAVRDRLDAAGFAQWLEQP